MSTEFNLKDLPNREVRFVVDGIVTGCPVRILSTDFDCNLVGVKYCIVAAIRGANGDEALHTFSSSGYDYTRRKRLIFKPIKKGYWIAVFKSGPVTYSTEDLAITYSANRPDFLYLHHVKWEE